MISYFSHGSNNLQSFFIQTLYYFLYILYDPGSRCHIDSIDFRYRSFIIRIIIFVGIAGGRRAIAATTDESQVLLEEELLQVSEEEDEGSQLVLLLLVLEESHVDEDDEDEQEDDEEGSQSLLKEEQLPNSEEQSEPSVNSSIKRVPPKPTWATGLKALLVTSRKGSNGPGP